MPTAETILNIIQDRGKRQLPLDDVYRQLFNPAMYLRSYAILYSNKGAMTPGITEETVDGMSQEKIAKIIEAIRLERWQWKPVRRVEIPKRKGGKRPLGMPTWSDKVVQDVIRSILEAYYEPQFSEHSHGFRPNRGCHSALTEIFTDRKSTRLNSSHSQISYAVFCLKKKKTHIIEYSAVHFLSPQRILAPIGHTLPLILLTASLLISLAPAYSMLRAATAVSTWRPRH